MSADIFGAHPHLTSQLAESYAHFVMFIVSLSMPSIETKTTVTTRSGVSNLRKRLSGRYAPNHTVSPLPFPLTSLVQQITNQTLSQSVPPTVVTAISGSTKVFVGNLIEHAREFQLQQISPSSSPSPPTSHASHYSSDLPASSSTFINIGNDDEDDIFASGPSNGNLSFEKTKEKKVNDLGPLLPEHLREAFRRHKHVGEGGGAGVGGVSVGLGVQGIAAARVGAGGKRLFR